MNAVECLVVVRSVDMRTFKLLVFVALCYTRDAASQSEEDENRYFT